MQALASLQRPLTSTLSTLANYTLSKCMSDPATTEITGPTIMNPADPNLDYTYCASDRRHIVNVSLVWRAPDFTRTTTRALFECVVARSFLRTQFRAFNYPLSNFAWLWLKARP